MNRRNIVIIIIIIFIIMLIIMKNNKLNKKDYNIDNNKRNIRIETENDVLNINGKKYNIYDETTNELIVTLNENTLSSAYMYEIDPDYNPDLNSEYEFNNEIEQ